jgi:pantothenate kinase type III
VGVDFNSVAAQSSTAIYKLLLNHIGETTVISTAAVVVTGVLEAVQQSYATIRKADGDAEYVVLGYVESISFPGN